MKMSKMWCTITEAESAKSTETFPLDFCIYTKGEKQLGQQKMWIKSEREFNLSN